MKLPIRITSDGTQAGTTIVDADGKSVAAVVRVCWKHSCHVNPSSSEDVASKMTLVMLWHESDDALDLPTGYDDDPDHKLLVEGS